MNFTEAKSILETVTDLVKKSATIDLQEKIMNLREYILSIKDENISLKEENQMLKLQFETQNNFEFKDGKYWGKGDDVPFCQKCLDGLKKRIRLQHWADGWKCYECTSYYPPRHKAGVTQASRPRIGE